jgi:predicted DNA repair protein MutK
MAGTSLLALLDDIATILDDVALMSKVAAKKTAGVLGDDLALNAEKVSGVSADRELPVVWAVFKGSLLNKIILVPLALAISAFLPWAITPLLMIGGAFLCFEGVEKIAHKYLHPEEDEQAEHQAKLAAILNPAVDMVAFEKEKIKGAVRTDFILSAEIIVIALGTVQGSVFLTQVLVVSAIAAVMTFGVYALVAGIVRLDDAGLYLMKGDGSGILLRIKRGVGAGILRAAPVLMKAISIIGTAAMFLVGGSILLHGLPMSHELMHLIETSVHALPVPGDVLSDLLMLLAPMLLEAVAGMIAGVIVLLAVTLIGRLLRKKTTQ